MFKLRLAENMEPSGTCALKCSLELLRSMNIPKKNRRGDKRKCKLFEKWEKLSIEERLVGPEAVKMMLSLFGHPYGSNGENTWNVMLTLLWNLIGKKMNRVIKTYRETVDIANTALTLNDRGRYAFIMFSSVRPIRQIPPRFATARGHLYELQSMAEVCTVRQLEDHVRALIAVDTPRLSQPTKFIEIDNGKAVTSYIRLDSTWLLDIVIYKRVSSENKSTGSKIYDCFLKLLSMDFFHRLFINNEFVNAKSGKTFETFNPATGDKIADVAEADKKDVNMAVKAAQGAFKLGSTWRRMDAAHRGVLLNRLADLMERHRQILASLETLDNGKPYAAFAFQADFTKGVVNVLSGYTAVGLVVEEVCSSGRVLNFLLRYITAISSHRWIDELRFIGSIEVGRIFMKPAADSNIKNKSSNIIFADANLDEAVKQAHHEQTPLSALHVASLINEAGFPEGVVNILPGYGPTAGGAIAAHPGIDKVAFTGSTEVGRIVMKTAADSNIKKVTLELGGKSPNIIFADANLDEAVKQAHHGLFFNQGQCCCAGSRTFVEGKIYDEFVARSKELAQKKVIGDPFDLKTEQGPQIDETQVNTVLSYVDIGKREDAKLVCGGKKVGDKGHFIEPTIFANVRDDMRIAQEEIFGPVTSVIRFDTMENLVEGAKNTIYGLAVPVFTKDIDRALYVANNIRAGSVWVNCYDVFDAAAPFGRYNQSGIGRELDEYGFKAYAEVKTVTFKVPQKNS